MEFDHSYQLGPWGLRFNIVSRVLGLQLFFVACWKNKGITDASTLMSIFYSLLFSVNPFFSNLSNKNIVPACTHLNTTLFSHTHCLFKELCVMRFDPHYTYICKWWRHYMNMHRDPGSVKNVVFLHSHIWISQTTRKQKGNNGQVKLEESWEKYWYWCGQKSRGAKGKRGREIKGKKWRQHPSLSFLFLYTVCYCSLVFPSPFVLLSLSPPHFS